MEIKNSLLKNTDLYRSKLDSAQETAASVRTRESGVAEQTAPQGDRVSLSPEARLHTAAFASANSAPDVRQDKVDAVKERIASGEYAVDSKSIAQKLLNTDALLAGTLKE